MRQRRDAVAVAGGKSSSRLELLAIALDLSLAPNGERERDRLFSLNFDGSVFSSSINMF